MVGLMMRMSRLWMIIMMGVWAWRRPMPMWCRRLLWRMVTVPVVSMRSCRIRQGVVVSPGLGWALGRRL